MLNYEEYLESLLCDEDDEIFMESFLSEDDDYMESELSAEYEKLQIMREAVEDKFLNNELDYEEYAMVLDKLDEKEAYLEAKVDDKLVSKIKKEYDVDNDDDAKRVMRATRRFPYDSREFGGSNVPKNLLLHNAVNLNSIESIKNKAKSDDDLKNMKGFARMTANLIDELYHDSKIAKKHANSSHTATKTEHDSLKGELAPVQQKALLVKQTAKVLEEDKKSHKKMIALIAAATAVGLGAGAIGIIAAKRNNADNMCKDLTATQDRLTDLGAERTTTLKLLTADRKSLAKTSLQDKDTAKELAKKIKKNEMKLKKLDAEILRLSRKVEVIKVKLDKMQKDVK